MRGRSAAAPVLALSLWGCSGELDEPTADVPPYAAVPISEEHCGNGLADPGELCDADTVSCASLGALYEGGSAVCRPDCRGYDVGSCRRTPTTLAETVKPRDRDGRFSQARCNAGESFAFQLRPSPTGSARWVIHLQGGGWCDDVSVQCRWRAECALDSGHALFHGVSMKDRALSPLAGRGVLSGDLRVNPGLADANHVFAFYCSSDFWSGTRSEPVDTSASRELWGRWHFAGRHHVAALIATLQQRYGLDDDDDRTFVVLTGTSAGGVGVVANAEYVAARVPRSAAAGRLRLIVDAGTYPGTLPGHDTLGWDEPRCGQTDPKLPDEEVFSRAMDLWGGAPGEECVRRNPDQPGRCYLTDVAQEIWNDRGWPSLVQQAARDPGYAAAYVGRILEDASDPPYAFFAERLRTRLARAPWAFLGGGPFISGRGMYHSLVDHDWGLAHCGRSHGRCTTPRYGELIERFLGAPPGAPGERVVFDDESTLPTGAGE
jgi:hypothetical protein